MEGDGADDGSQGDFSKPNRAAGAQDDGSPQSAALPASNGALEGDGEQCGDNSKGNIKGEGFRTFRCCRQDSDDDSGASDNATSIAGGHDILRSLQSPPLLDAVHENRKRRRELVSQCDEHDAQAFPY